MIYLVKFETVIEIFCATKYKKECTTGTDVMDVSPRIPSETTVNIDRRGMVFRGPHDCPKQNFFLYLSDPTRPFLGFYIF